MSTYLLTFPQNNPLWIFVQRRLFVPARVKFPAPCLLTRKHKRVWSPFPFLLEKKPALKSICIPSAVFHCSVDCSLVWDAAPGLHETPNQQLTSFMCWMVLSPANEEYLFSPAAVYIQDAFPVWSPHLTPQITICHMLMYFRYRWRHYSCNSSHGKIHRLATLFQLKH